MGTFTNSEDPDELPHNVAFHQSLHYLKSKKKKLTLYTMDHPKFILSNQKEESISIQNKG